MYIKNTTHLFMKSKDEVKRRSVGGEVGSDYTGKFLWYGCNHSFSNISQTNEKQSNAAVSLSLTCKSFSGNITFVDKTY